jgi:hypothetical protein
MAGCNVGDGPMKWLLLPPPQKIKKLKIKINK